MPYVGAGIAFGAPGRRGLRQIINGMSPVTLGKTEYRETATGEHPFP